MLIFFPPTCRLTTFLWMEILQWQLPNRECLFLSRIAALAKLKLQHTKMEALGSAGSVEILQSWITPVLSRLSSTKPLPASSWSPKWQESLEEVTRTGMAVLVCRMTGLVGRS